MAPWQRSPAVSVADHSAVKHSSVGFSSKSGDAAVLTRSRGSHGIVDNSTSTSFVRPEARSRAESRPRSRDLRALHTTVRYTSGRVARYTDIGQTWVVDCGVKITQHHRTWALLRLFLISSELAILHAGERADNGHKALCPLSRHV